jgi:transcriptional regulator with GAF, ATPase, and Fis domain
MTPDHDRIVDQLTALNFRVTLLEEALHRCDRWPAWFDEVQAGIQAAQEIALAACVDVRRAFSPCRRTRNIDRDTVIAGLRARGWSVSKIARLFGTNERTVKKAARRLGCPVKPSR